MAATRKDRGNSLTQWASRAPLNDDRAPIVAKLFEATFWSWACSWEARWLFCRLLTGGLTIRRQTADLRGHLASDVGTDPQKIFFVEWYAACGVFCFFLVRTTIVESLHGQQDVQCSKVHLLAETSWTDDKCKGPGLSVSFERPRSPTWTSPQLTTSAFLESSSLCHVLCECHNKAGVGTNVDIRSSNSFLIQRICLHSDTPRQSYCKESDDYTADSFSQSESPMLSATRSPKQASEGAQNQTRQ